MRNENVMQYYILMVKFSVGSLKSSGLYTNNLFETLLSLK